MSSELERNIYWKFDHIEHQFDLIERRIARIEESTAGKQPADATIPQPPCALKWLIIFTAVLSAIATVGAIVVLAVSAL